MHVRDCFISHAFEDKDAVARPLAQALMDAGYEVWYDESELEVGDSLREKIDEGLAGSRFGVVVLSQRFFEKNWAKFELEALVARQMIGSERVILPVWHEIDEDYLEKVSPTLASIVGVPSSPLETAVEKIAKRIDRRRDSGSSGGALVAAQASRPAPSESDPERLVRTKERVKLGYTDEELAIFRGEGGSSLGPGWLSVVVGPTTLSDDLIDPTEVKADGIEAIEIEDPWYTGDVLMNRYGLRAGLDGYAHRRPETPLEPPDYLMRIGQDGLMEYGETITIAGEHRRLLPYSSLTERIHDYVLLFLKVLEEVGYLGDAAAIATFGGMAGFELGLPRDAYYPTQHPVEVDMLESRVLRASVTEMPDLVGAWLKKTMDRFFLAAGISSGAFFMTDEGLIKKD